MAECGRPREARRHGFQWPLHPFQALSWVVFSLDVAVFAGFVFLIEHEIAQVVVAACFGISVLVIIVSTARATACDSSDPHLLLAEGSVLEGDGEVDSMTFCTICNLEVYSRSKHCRACNKCVHVFDHHCMWINNCVGEMNYMPFFVSISSVALMLCTMLATSAYLLVDYFLNEDAFERRADAWPVLESLPKEVFPAVLIALCAVNLPLFLLDLQLVLLHIFLMSQRLTTYEYISGHQSLAQPQHRTRGGSGAGSLRKLPRCMDWIFFSKCGRRRRSHSSKSGNVPTEPDTALETSPKAIERLDADSKQPQRPDAVAASGAETAGTPTESFSSSAGYWDAKYPRLLPWEAGGRYRTPRRLQLRDGPENDSTVHGAIPAGSLVAVWEVHRAGLSPDNPEKSQLLCAFVTVQDGQQCGQQGWVFCAAKDIHQPPAGEAVDEVDEEVLALPAKAVAEGEDLSPSMAAFAQLHSKTRVEELDPEEGLLAWPCGLQSGLGDENRVVQDVGTLQDSQQICAACTCTPSAPSQPTEKPDSSTALDLVAHADGEDVVAVWLHNVYARYNPDKLDSAAELLREQRASGGEAEFVDAVARKYRVGKPPRSPQAPPALRLQAQATPATAPVTWNQVETPPPRMPVDGRT